jgi:hypothetical protein
MDKRTAIRECKAMWAEIAATGLGKEAFLETPQGLMWEMKHYFANCPLCYYVVTRKDSDCYKCPLYQQLNATCFNLGYKGSHPCPEFWEAVKKLKVHG